MSSLDAHHAESIAACTEGQPEKHARIMAGEEPGPARKVKSIADVRSIFAWWQAASSVLERRAKEEGAPLRAIYHGAQAVAYHNMKVRLDEFIGAGEWQEQLDLFGGES